LTRQHTFFEGGKPAETTRQLNAEVLILLQIEHREAIERLPDLLSIPGIDGAFVGPADLSASMGMAGQTEDSRFLEAVHRVIDVAKAHGVIPGIHTDSLKTAEYWMKEGMQIIGFYTDIKLILEISKNSVHQLRTVIQDLEARVP
jgi:4-hydroxy-2-oxoheptanedioate aldolase